VIRRGRTLRAIRAVALGLACLLAAARAHGETEGDTAPDREVRMHLAADAATSTVLAEGVRARLEDLGVMLTWDVVQAVDAGRVLAGGAASAAPELAEVWFDARTPGEATLLVLPREGDGVLARRFSVPTGFDDVAQAEIAYIIERAVSTLLAAEPFGVSRAAARAELGASAQPAPPPAPTVTAAPPAGAPAPRLALQFGAAAGVQTWSTADPFVPAASAFLGVERLASRGGIGVAASGGVRAGVRTATADARIVASSVDLHLWLTLSRAFARVGTWHLSLGPGLFLEHVAVTPFQDALHTVKPQTRSDVDPTLGAQVRWDFARLGRAALFGAVSVDALPWPARYTALVDGVTTNLMEPWLVRPSLTIGVAVSPDLAAQ
jgi:hypothetical protein